MKIKLLITFLVLTTLLTACQTATPPPPVLITENAEFTLAPDQTATLVKTGLLIRLIGVAGDERCPSEIECAASGPVSISLSIQVGNEESGNINMQTFTGSDGRAPDMQFEGIESRLIYEGYLIRVTSVLPYPVNSTKEIKDSKYRVSLVVSKQ